MDQPSLEQLVTNEAKFQAESLIADAEHESLQYTGNEKVRLEALYQDQKQKLLSEYESKKSFLFFTMDSDYKKKILQKKQSVMDQLTSVLQKNFLEIIRLKPNLLLKKTLLQLSAKNGEVYVSQELSTMITQDLVHQFNQENHSTFEYKGVDTQLEPGIAVQKGTIKYIYSLKEFIDTFLEKNHSDITKLLEI